MIVDISAASDSADASSLIRIIVFFNGSVHSQTDRPIRIGTLRSLHYRLTHMRQGVTDVHVAATKFGKNYQYIGVISTRAQQ